MNMKENLCKLVQNFKMAVVGWWTGYKLGGVIALNVAEIFEKSGFQNYWQMTILCFRCCNYSCNIGLMFINEPQPNERTNSQAETDNIIQNKLGSSNFAKIFGEKNYRKKKKTYNEFFKKWL